MQPLDQLLKQVTAFDRAERPTLAWCYALEQKDAKSAKTGRKSEIRVSLRTFRSSVSSFPALQHRLPEHQQQAVFGVALLC